MQVPYHGIRVNMNQQVARVVNRALAQSVKGFDSEYGYLNCALPGAVD
jgi:hypothetical protein